MRAFGYVAFKGRHSALAATFGVERHISTGATLRTKCGAPHLVRKSRTPGSVGEVPGNRHLYPTTVDLQIRKRAVSAVALRDLTWPFTLVERRRADPVRTLIATNDLRTRP